MVGVSAKLRSLILSAILLGFSPLAFSAASDASPSESRTLPTENKTVTSEYSGYKEADIPENKLNSRILFQLIASEIALQRGQLGAAYQTYLTLIEETKDPRIAERAAQIALAANAPKEFGKVSEEWIKLAPDNQKAQEAFIASGIIAGKWDKITPVAIELLNNAKDRGAEILKLQTQLALSKDKLNALAFFKKATSKYTKLYQTQLGIARLEALTGNFESAQKNARAAYNLEKNEDTVLTYGTILIRSNPKEAKTLLSDFLSKNPKDVRIRDAYSQLLLQNKDFNGLNRLQKEYREDNRYLLALAISYLQLQEVSRAKNILEPLVKRLESEKAGEEDLSRAYLLLSDIAAESKDYEKALDYTTKVKGKLSSAAALQRANLYTRLSQWDKAIASLDAIKPDQDIPIAEEAALLKSRILLETEDEKAAFNSLNDSLIKLPFSKALHYEVAMLAERLDDVKTAEFHLKKAIEIDPRFANAYNSLGYTLLERTKRIREAEKYINQAYALEPKNPYILDSKGWLAFKQKKYKQAIGYLQEALELQKELDIYLHLTEVYWQQGNKQKAVETLDNAGKIWPQAPEIETLKKRLKI